MRISIDQWSWSSDKTEEKKESSKDKSGDEESRI
jgi:hypothetical protein